MPATLENLLSEVTNRLHTKGKGERRSYRSILTELAIHVISLACQIRKDHRRGAVPVPSSKAADSIPPLSSPPETNPIKPEPGIEAIPMASRIGIDIDKLLILAALGTAGVALYRTRDMATQLQNLKTAYEQAFRDMDAYTNKLSERLDRYRQQAADLQARLQAAQAEDAQQIAQAAADELAPMVSGLQVHAEALRQLSSMGEDGSVITQPEVPLPEPSPAAPALEVGQAPAPEAPATNEGGGQAPTPAPEEGGEQGQVMQGETPPPAAPAPATPTPPSTPGAGGETPPPAATTPAAAQGEAQAEIVDPLAPQNVTATDMTNVGQQEQQPGQAGGGPAGTP